ncbi:uncharacterized protein LOC113464644 [Ceratina calcarata]|uniref:Uncharacterized protein LOC113464644 n=1 Tax=Ceratina calcarata TaxID=156304 RepID=A0AAJ7WCH1_9HYME|nr:uncharacterized protein LOC113464644 [Ceratina calcarata]
MNKNPCKERNKGYNPKVCLGWTQEWMSPRRIGRNKFLNVREIVRGPFSSPKLIRTRPFVSCTSGQQFRTISDDCCSVRRGIPDAWREYLACRGLCGTAEITVLRKNLIPSCIRSIATDRLWNEAGLPLIQGIPDPFKSKSVRHCNSNKYLRQRRSRSKYFYSRTGYVYDGDDEAEIERGAECQFNKKGLLQKKQKELNLTERESPSKRDKKDDLTVLKDEKTLVTSNKIAELSQSRKRKGDDAEKKTNSTKIELRPTIRRTPEKAHVHNPKVSLPKKREGASNVKKKIQTEVMKKTSAAAQTDRTVKPRIEQVQDPLPSRNLGMNTSNSTWPHAVCCNCLLQNYMTYLSGFSNRLKDPANHVLCQNCENAYYKKQQCKIPARTTGRYCTPDLRNYPNPRPPTIYEWTKLKFCDCVQKARGRFGTEEPDRCKIKTRHTFVSKEEMKLICYRCDSPYLRIQNKQVKSLRQKTCPCKKKKWRVEQKNLKDPTLKSSTARKRRRSISCSSKRCGTCIGNKDYVYQPNLEQSSIITYKNNVVKDTDHQPEENGYRLEVQALCEDVRRNEGKKEKSRVANSVEAYIAPSHQRDSSVTILYLASDSGEDADISDDTKDERGCVK